MLETLLERPFFLNRHREALLKEREVFLGRLQQQGTSRVALQNLSGELIHIVRLLRLEPLRDVGEEEIHKAAQRWARQQWWNPKRIRAAKQLPLYLCCEEMASPPRPPETAKCATHAVR